MENGGHRVASDGVIGNNLEMMIVFKGSSREPTSKGRKWKIERLERDLEIREERKQEYACVIFA